MSRRHVKRDQKPFLEIPGYRYIHFLENSEESNEYLYNQTQHEIIGICFFTLVKFLGNIIHINNIKQE